VNRTGPAATGAWIIERHYAYQLEQDIEADLVQVTFTVDQNLLQYLTQQNY